MDLGSKLLASPALSRTVGPTPTPTMSAHPKQSSSHRLLDSSILWVLTVNLQMLRLSVKIRHSVSQLSVAVTKSPVVKVYLGSWCQSMA